MTRHGWAILAFAALGLGGCGGTGGAIATPAAPTVQFQANTPFSPSYWSPCAGGTPDKQYNCPQGRN